MVIKRLAKEDAYRALENGADRHTKTIATGQIGSRARLFAPELLATFEMESQCMRDFLAEAETSERRLDRIVDALHLMMRDSQICALLASEGLLTMPKLLAHRLEGAPRDSLGKPLSDKDESRAPVGGICPEVLDVLRDIPVKTKMFGLLQKVLPARQLEITHLMVAMDRVGLTSQGC